MIESIHLGAFQNHLDRLIELEKVTVLVGENDAGKSAVLRALRWTALNEWDGDADAFIHWDCDHCTVDVEVDGVRLRREKGKRGNKYWLDDKEFAAFGKGVPSEVQTLLNLTEDNFQGQLDAAFWLSLRSGEAASALNQIFNLTAIDDAIDVVSKESREAKTRETLCQEWLTQSEEKVESLRWVEDANALLEELESKEQEMTTIKERVQELMDGAREMQRIQSSMKWDAEALGLLNQILEKATQLGKTEGEIEVFRNYILLEEDKAMQERKLVELQKALNEALQGQCPLCERGGKQS